MEKIEKSRKLIMKKSLTFLCFIEFTFKILYNEQKGKQDFFCPMSRLQAQGNGGTYHETYPAKKAYFRSAGPLFDAVHRPGSRSC